MAKGTNKMIEKKLSPLLKKTLKRAELDFMKCARVTNHKIHKDVQEMYRTFISQFYQYKTTSYIRHFEGVPGTRYGENLVYPIKGIRVDNRASHSPKLYIELWASEMSNNPPYEHHTPEGVLFSVLHGIRFATQNGYVMEADTNFNYHGTYFSYSGSTIQRAFDLFDKNWDDISHDAFYERWGEYVDKWV